MGKSDATFRHHLDEVTEAQFKCDVPSHTQNDDLLVKVPSLEQILCRGRFRHPGSYRRIPSLSTVCTRTHRTWAVRSSRLATPMGRRAIYWSAFSGKHIIAAPASFATTAFPRLRNRFSFLALEFYHKRPRPSYSYMVVR